MEPSIESSIRRRLLVTGLAVASVITGCGSDGAEDVRSVASGTDPVPQAVASPAGPSVDPLLSSLSAADRCGREHELAAWAVETLGEFPVDAPRVHVLDAGRVVPLMRDLEPACVDAIADGPFAAWSARSADGSLIVRGASDPGDQSPWRGCYEAPGRGVEGYWQDGIGSGHGVTGCRLPDRVLGVWGPSESFDTYQDFVIEFGPEYVEPGPFLEVGVPDLTSDVMRRLMISGPLHFDIGRGGWGERREWPDGYFPCAQPNEVFLTEPQENSRPEWADIVEICDETELVARFVRSEWPRVPDAAAEIRGGPVPVVYWERDDGTWVVAADVHSPYGHLSIESVVASVPVDVFADRLLAMSVLHPAVVSPSTGDGDLRDLLDAQWLQDRIEVAGGIDVSIDEAHFAGAPGGGLAAARFTFGDAVIRVEVSGNDMVDFMRYPGTFLEHYRGIDIFTLGPTLQSGCDRLGLRMMHDSTPSAVLTLHHALLDEFGCTED